MEDLLLFVVPRLYPVESTLRSGCSDGGRSSVRFGGVSGSRSARLSNGMLSRFVGSFLDGSVRCLLSLLVTIKFGNLQLHQTMRM